jgi:hypothetical protein
MSEKGSSVKAERSSNIFTRYLKRGSSAPLQTDTVPSERPASDADTLQDRLHREPDDATLWLEHGHAFARQGLTAEATRAYYKCLSLDLIEAAKRRGLQAHIDGFIGSGNLLGAIDPATLKPRTPGIFMVSLPKSGTVFIQDALCAGLRARPVAFPSGGFFPHVTIPQSAVDRVTQDSRIYVIHAPASPQNRIELNYRIDRLVVHIRDLRQSLLSFAHFIGSVVRHNDPVQAYHFRVPLDFCDRPLRERIDILLNGYMQDQVDWVQSWIDAERDESFKPDILFLSQEQLVKDQTGYFDLLLGFHGIDRDQFTYPPLPEAGKKNFRSGRTDEWREAFLPDQLKRATDMIPLQMRQKFGWPD